MIGTNIPVYRNKLPVLVFSMPSVLVLEIFAGGGYEIFKQKSKSKLNKDSYI
jgi:hypothetical protein